MPRWNNSAPGNKCSAKPALNSRSAAVAAIPDSPTSTAGTPPASTATLGACDCLNWCGDDTRVKEGRVRPCESLLASMREAAELKATRQRLHECARRVLASASDPDIITLATFVEKETS